MCMYVFLTVIKCFAHILELYSCQRKNGVDCMAFSMPLCCQDILMPTHTYIQA